MSRKPGKRMSNDTFPALFAAAFQRMGHELAEPDLEPGPCELCGHEGERVRWRPRPSWTAYSTHAVPGAGALCLGCDLLLNGRCPDPGPSGKPMKWVFLTLATDGERAMWATKAHKDRIAEWVADERFSVSVADGGKKQIAYLAPLAVPGQVSVGFDGRPVRIARDEWSELCEQIDFAYSVGVSKARLLSGLSVIDWERLGDRARELDALLRRRRHTAELELAVWLARKPEQPTESTQLRLEDH